MEHAQSAGANPTVSLQLIVKDEYDRVLNLVQDALPHVTEVNLTVSDKPTANKMKKFAENLNRQAPAGRSINVKWREWNNRFDEARNANYEMSTTDYTFWLDADDMFDFRLIPYMVDLAEKNGIDAIFLPYNYAQDDQGNCITRHWRERLVRANKGFTWRGWVHETYISDQPHVTHKLDHEVRHATGPNHTLESLERNHKILEEAAEATGDPRYIHYLGMSYYTRKEYGKAIETLSDYLEVGGSKTDIYRSLSLISESAYHLGMHEEALEYASKCIVLKPEAPTGYWLMAQYEADRENWQDALEHVKTAQGKPDPDDNSIFDPTARARAACIAAQAEFYLGHYSAALAWLKKAGNNPVAQDLLADFTEEAANEQFIKLIPSIRSFFQNDKALFDSLSDDLKYDARLRDLRFSVTQPKTWDDKSIVIFCGQGFEEWGPHTLDKGMGGSEEAIVYLSAELAKLGYNVTVYGEANIPSAHLVTWLPWKQMDPRDNFNVFVSWRNPLYLEKVNAKVKLADIHDVMPPEMMKDYPDVTYLLKSAYHRSLSPDLPDEKIKVIGNGIVKAQFKENK